MSSDRGDAEARAAPDDGARGDGDDALEAIGALERLLEQRHGLSAVERGAHTPVASADGQYSIPLLDEVVVPGVPAPAPQETPIELSPTAKLLFERLASEIDVIVQTGVDDALKAAAKNIRARVKQHVAIVLPEILDELSQADGEDGPPRP